MTLPLLKTIPSRNACTFFFSWYCEQVSMFFGSYSKSTSSSAFILSQELFKRLFSIPPCHCYHHWIVLADRNAPLLAFYLKLSELGKLCHFSFFFSSYAFYSLGDGPHFLWELQMQTRFRRKNLLMLDIVILLHARFVKCRFICQEKKCLWQSLIGHYFRDILFDVLFRVRSLSHTLQKSLIGARVVIIALQSYSKSFIMVSATVEVFWLRMAYVSTHFVK